MLFCCYVVGDDGFFVYLVDGVGIGVGFLLVCVGYGVVVGD